jgi:preprotein translocase subunit SecD
MYKNLRWKVLTSVTVFLIFFSVGVYPVLAGAYHWPCPAFLRAKQLKLGLDLKGGVHLVIKVNTDDALKLTTTAIGEQLRQSLTTSGINVGAINYPSPTSFRVEAVPSDKDAAFRQAADEVAAVNYDRNPQAGGAYEFKM